MLSYAQRLEDHHLACAFAGQAEGFYVDIGGGHPVADNVSFHFYLAGWRGLVVEPQKKLLALYEHIRPRDIAVGLLVGREPGEAEFHQFGTLHGFSTMVATHAAEAAKADSDRRVIKVPVTTLAALCEVHGITRIDFLKIDVEGAEVDVLAGADLARVRPRLIVAEAVSPGSMAPAHEAFEPILTRAGYRFTLFDGLNRFYVAEEETELLARCPKEPADWGVVRHLYEFGRAPDMREHPDHVIARALVGGFLGGLPARPLREVRRLLASAGLPETSEEDLRAALGRIAAPYDGGLDLGDDGGS